MEKRIFQRRVVRGLVDTDGSVYKLRKGAQVSFCNCSKKLLDDARKILVRLKFSPSFPSSNKIYLTKQKDILRYNYEIGFANKKHQDRFLRFMGDK
ncbi:MAG: LAGLIDADG family homing endonuclease [Candidatus Magasanikbacteria bacterium]|nr:LAGLIDADG family homing endonuclease [Candidatus Magasanikbacteria bacterium]